VSFRGRLILFFVLIVALPMVAVAVLVSDVTDSSATGKADAALTADLDVATSIYNESVDDAAAAAKRIATDPSFQAAVTDGNPDAIRAAGSELADQQGVRYLKLTDSDGARLAEIGQKPAFATAAVDLVQGAGGPQTGTLRVSTTTAGAYLDEVQARTGEGAVIVGPHGTEGSVKIALAEIPSAGEAADTNADGEEQRVAAEALSGSGDLRVAVIGPTESGGFFSSRPAVAAALVGFFLVALIAVGFLTRSLQGQIAAMLGAARRIGEGDFSTKVPVEGQDELAGLASEFNKMSDRLTDQMDELRRQQLEIERSVERIGQAFASGLDRGALLKILVDTVLSACNAEYGLVALSGRVGAEAEAGEPTEATSDAALTAEHRAVRDGGLAEGVSEGAYALSSPLGRIGHDDSPVGVMTVARAGEPFTRRERDVFLYLVGQAAASVENIALHELVAEQAVTDELTGLPNHRAFRDVMDKEGARAERFSHDLSLLILDIDDFKRVNDTHGHLQGDAVLQAIGRIVGEESRGIDEPARYGGEEFVVALPETGLDGAVELGERIRSRIEAEPVPLVDSAGSLRVTASFGAATMEPGNSGVNALVAAADAALYDAKRSGKNRVAVAQPGVDGHGPDDRGRAKGRTAARRK
jgi:diguanylate cyclase (GGDEF)-like protein